MEDEDEDANYFNYIFQVRKIKICEIKITKIGKREIQTRFILVRPLPMPTSIPQATHLIFFTIFVKLFYNF